MATIINTSSLFRNSGGTVSVDTGFKQFKQELITKLNNDSIDNDVTLADALIQRISQGDNIFSKNDTTKISVGGLPSGSNLNDKTYTQIFEDILYSENISIKTASINPTNARVGSAKNITLTFTTNKTPTFISINGQQQDIPISANNTYTYTFNNITTTTSYQIIVKDEKNTSDTKTLSTTFYYYIYRTAATEPVSTFNNLSSLTEYHFAKANSNTKTGISLTADNNKYYYFYIPTIFSIVNIKVGGFLTQFEKLDTQIEENNNISYNIYKSSNANLGSNTFEIEVKTS